MGFHTQMKILRYDYNKGCRNFISPSDDWDLQDYKDYVDCINNGYLEQYCGKSFWINLEHEDGDICDHEDYYAINYINDIREEAEYFVVEIDSGGEDPSCEATIRTLGEGECEFQEAIARQYDMDFVKIGRPKITKLLHYVLGEDGEYGETLVMENVMRRVCDPYEI